MRPCPSFQTAKSARRQRKGCFMKSSADDRSERSNQRRSPSRPRTWILKSAAGDAYESRRRSNWAVRKSFGQVTPSRHILVGSRDEPFSQEPWMSGHVPRDITVGHPEVTGKRTIGRRLGPDRTGASSMLATRWVSWTARPGQRVRQVRVIAASPGNRCHICDQRQAESVAGMPRGARRAARCWDRAHANVARKPPMKAAVL